MNAAADVSKALRAHASKTRAKALLRFFKTGKGEYGEGDRFLGLTMPQVRTVVKRFRDLSVPEIKKLIRSPWHEERMCGLLLLVDQFQRGDEKIQERIYKTYLASTKWINNWDLVDVTTPRVVGAYLETRPRQVLYDLASSHNLWERRIAIIATLWFISKNETKDACKIAQRLLKDRHDLIHKASGWALREAGKRDKKALITFLKKYAATMPRTMLRYAIEKLPEKERKTWLNHRSIA